MASTDFSLALLFDLCSESTGSVSIELVDLRLAWAEFAKGGFQTELILNTFSYGLVMSKV